MLIKNQFHVYLPAQMQTQQYSKHKLMQLIITMYVYNNAHYLIMLIYQLKDAYLYAQTHIIMTWKIINVNYVQLSVHLVLFMMYAQIVFLVNIYRMGNVW